MRNEKGQFTKGHIPWHKDKTKEDYPQLSNSGAKKGKFLSEGHRIKLSNAQKLRYQKETIWNKGKKLSKEHREKLKRPRPGAQGENNWRWIKDRSVLTMNKRNDPEYKQWVKKVKKRDNNTCQLKDENCFGYNLAHHIKSWSKYPKLRYKVSNGITLCQAHHPKKRAKEKQLIPMFQGLVGSSV